MNAELSDILSTDPATGRALLSVPGYPMRFLLACRLRDIHPMGSVRQWIVGATTPGMTWTDGVFISLFWLAYRLGRKQLEDLVRFILHEIGGHWWQCWRRMGPQDFRATYGWQIGVTFFKRLGRKLFGPPLQPGEMTHTLHDDHIMESEANRVANDLLAAAKAAWIEAGQSAGFTFDTVPWLEAHYPALR